MKHVIALFFFHLPKVGCFRKKQHLPGWCDPFEVYLCAFFLKNTEKNSNLFMFRFFVVVVSVYHSIPPEAFFCKYIYIYIFSLLSYDE